MTDLSNAFKVLVKVNNRFSFVCVFENRMLIEVRGTMGGFSLLLCKREGPMEASRRTSCDIGGDFAFRARNSQDSCSE
jgi:hypothetical protein